jgi:nitroreductase
MNAEVNRVRDAQNPMMVEWEAMGSLLDRWSVGPNGEPGPLLRECLLAAIAAPSIHNSQPWRFRVTPTGIDVYADRNRTLVVVDPAGRELFMSVGAAIFNLRVAMLALGRQPVMRLLPDGPHADLAARVTPGPFVHASKTAQALARAIPRRHTNRRPFADVLVPPWILAELVRAAGVEGAELAIADQTGRDALLGIIRTAEVRRRREPRYWLELAAWTFWRRGRRDGVPPAAFGPWSAAEAVPLRDFGLIHQARRRRVERFEPNPTLAMLSTSSDGPEAWLRSGQALERVLLTATVRGLAATPMTQPVEIGGLRKLLCGRDSGRIAQAIVRIGYGRPSSPSPRRPLDEVLVLD